MIHLFFRSNFSWFNFTWSRSQFAGADIFFAFFYESIHSKTRFIDDIWLIRSNSELTGWKSTKMCSNDRSKSFNVLSV